MVLLVHVQANGESEQNDVTKSDEKLALSGANVTENHIRLPGR
jgi:hypothetical protein